MITVQQAAAMPAQQRHHLLNQVHATLKRNRRDLDALLSAAALHYAENQIRPTVDLLGKAHKLQPKNLMIVQWLSVAAAEIRDFKTAKAASKQLVALDAANPENWNIRGRILDSAADPAGALEAFSRRRKLVGDEPELLFQMANCHFYMGDHPAAEAQYRRVLELEPTHALALYGLSTIHKFSEEEIADYVKAVEDAVPANRDLPPYNISAMYYGVGKAFDDVGDHDSAFDWYRKANEVRRPDDTVRLSHQFDNARTAFSADYIQARKNWGDSSRQPIFVLGMPRSGTTLVESLIAAHPRISAGGELPALQDIALQIGAMQAPTEEFAAIARKLTQSDVKDMARTYIEGARAFCGVGDHFTDKMPHNFMLIGLALLLFPKARIIHCRRDPVDTCVSIYTNGMTPAHNYYKSDLSTLGTYYNLYLELMAYWHEIFPGRILDVYYEDVTANTELNARQLIEFCGLKWDDRVLNREQSQSAVRTLSAWQVRQPVYTTAQGKWRRYEKHLEPLLDTLGESVASYQKSLASLTQENGG